MTDSITGINILGQVETEGAFDDETSSGNSIFRALGLGNAFSVSSATETWDISNDRIVVDYSGIGSVFGDAEQPYKSRFVFNGQAVPGKEDPSTASDFQIDTIGVGFARADGTEAILEATPAPQAFTVRKKKRKKNGKVKKITKTMFRPTTINDIGDIITKGDGNTIVSLLNGNTINIYESRPAGAASPFGPLAGLFSFDAPVSTLAAAAPSSADAFAAGWSGF